jgi:acetyltransferase
MGSAVDPVFGPVILFGQGGTAVELVADRAIALPPLNEPLARSLVARTRVSRLLRGWRDVPPADLESVHRTLIQVSQMLADLPELAEIDINPLIASPEGVVALDARIRVTAQNAGGAARFAIRPYPAELVETVVWKGRELVLRPIRPDDELRHIEFLTHLDPEDIRLRIFYTRRTMERSELARLTQIDYTREMAFIAVAAGPDGLLQTLGVARAMTDPDNISAEFGVIVRSELKGGGLGRILMDKLIRYLRANGTRRLEAVVLQENTRMLEMARRLGLRDAPEQPEFDTRALVMDLQDEAALA